MAEQEPTVAFTEVLETSRRAIVTLDELAAQLDQLNAQPDFRPEDRLVIDALSRSIATRATALSPVAIEEALTPADEIIAETASQTKIIPLRADEAVTAVASETRSNGNGAGQVALDALVELGATDPMRSPETVIPTAAVNHDDVSDDEEVVASDDPSAVSGTELPTPEPERAVVDEPTQPSRRPSFNPAGYSKRQLTLVAHMVSQPGVRFSPAELGALLPSNLKDGARYQATRKTLQAIQNDPALSPRLRFDGETAARRYWLEPEPVAPTGEFSSSVASAPGTDTTGALASANGNGSVANTEPCTSAEAKKDNLANSSTNGARSETPNDEPIELTDWGLTLGKKQGYHTILLNGKALLPIRPVVADTIAVIARHHGPITFSGLLELLSANDPTVQPETLQGTLHQIRNLFEKHKIDQHWLDRTINTADGPDRIINIKGKTPQGENPDFLAQTRR